MGASEVIGRMEVSLAEGSDEWVIGDMGINKTKRKEVGWNWSSVWGVAGLHGGWTRKSDGTQGLENLGVREVTGKSTPGPQNTCAWWEWRNRWRKGSGVAAWEPFGLCSLLPLQPGVLWCQSIFCLAASWDLSSKYGSRSLFGVYLVTRHWKPPWTGGAPHVSNALTVIPTCPLHWANRIVLILRAVTPLTCN